MRKNSGRKRQIFVAVIALILIAMMVMTLVAAVAWADALQPVDVTAGSVTSSEQSGSDGTAAEDQSGNGTGQTSASDGTEAVSGSVSASSDSLTPAKQRGSVYIENINTTGMTLQQIRNAVSEKMKELSDETIVFYAGDNTASVKAGTLGLTYTNTEIADAAYSIGRKGNILKRFLADRELAAGQSIVLELDLEVSENSVRNAISSKLDVLNSEPKANGMKLQADHTFRLTEGHDGVTVNAEASVKKVVDYMNTEWHGGQGAVNLDADITPYGDSVEDLTKVKDLLGSGTTAYASGNINHDTNVELAAANIDGTVLYPGEEFSAEKAIGPTTEENGFLPGDTYSGNKITETYGGGVCQVSSTLYNAVLQAELEVTERHNHSFLVSYVQPGFDAAISEGTLDFRFVNNTSAPIYIQAVLQNGNLTFNIYGQETRSADREVVYDSRTSDPVEVKTVFTTDSTKAFGGISVSGGIAGLTADLYKTVYVNGEEESEDLVTESVYSMMPLTYTVGTQNADADTIRSINAAISDGSLEEVQTAVANGSVVQTDS